MNRTWVQSVMNHFHFPCLAIVPCECANLWMCMYVVLLMLLLTFLMLYLCAHNYVNYCMGICVDLKWQLFRRMQLIAHNSWHNWRRVTIGWGERRFNTNKNFKNYIPAIKKHYKGCRQDFFIVLFPSFGHAKLPTPFTSLPYRT